MLAYALKEVEGDDAAVLLLQGYLRAYGDGPGADSARDAIAGIRGVYRKVGDFLCGDLDQRGRR